MHEVLELGVKDLKNLHFAAVIIQAIVGKVFRSGMSNSIGSKPIPSTMSSIDSIHIPYCTSYSKSVAKPEIFLGASDSDPIPCSMLDIGTRQILYKYRIGTGQVLVLQQHRRG